MSINNQAKNSKSFKIKYQIAKRVNGLITLLIVILPVLTYANILNSKTFPDAFSMNSTLILFGFLFFMFFMFAAVKDLDTDNKIKDVLQNNSMEQNSEKY